jgi:hypothetical protein
MDWITAAESVIKEQGGPTHRECNPATITHQVRKVNNMDENVVLKELQGAIDNLKILALVALDMEESHPLALPEPPEPRTVAAYEQHMQAITQHVAAGHRPLLAKSLRDYQAGFPDRAGSYLQELVGRFLQDSEYATAFSPTARRQLEGYLADLGEV